MPPRIPKADAMNRMPGRALQPSQEPRAPKSLASPIPIPSSFFMCRYRRFNSPEARKSLETITHPLIRQETTRQALQLNKDGAPYLVFVVPLLIESGSWKDLIDRLVVVDCPKETQINRVMQRSNLTQEEVERILVAQASREERLKHADVVIENQGSLKELEAEVENLHQKILQI